VAITGDKGRLELEVIDQVGRVFVAAKRKLLFRNRGSKLSSADPASRLSHVWPALRG